MRGLLQYNGMPRTSMKLVHGHVREASRYDIMSRISTRLRCAQINEVEIHIPDELLRDGARAATVTIGDLVQQITLERARDIDEVHQSV